MNLDLVVKIVGVLGFLISVTTFILTRIERRKNVQIEIFETSIHDFPELLKDTEWLGGESMFKVRFTNIGPQPVILKPETFRIEHNGNCFALAREDYLGKEEIRELMPPTTYQEIGIDRQLVISMLKIHSPDKYDDRTFNKLFHLRLSVCDHTGKVFRNNMHSYHEAVGEVVTKS